MRTAPISEAALRQFPEFVDQVKKRLEVGCHTYGDNSFTRPLHEVVQELMQEALDMAGWGFILYRRLSEIERLAAAGAATEKLVRMNVTDWTMEHALQVTDAA